MKPTLLSSVLVALLNVAPALAQAPVPPVPATRPTVASNATDYKLVVGDKLRVEVYRDPQMSQILQIRPDGKITLPLVGDVAAAGKTPAALRDSLTASLKEFITNPVVTVIVVEAQPQTISVIGEVNGPGTHPIKGANHGHRSAGHGRRVQGLREHQEHHHPASNTDGREVDQLQLQGRDQVRGTSRCASNRAT